MGLPERKKKRQRQKKECPQGKSANFFQYLEEIKKNCAWYRNAHVSYMALGTKFPALKFLFAVHILIHIFITKSQTEFNPDQFWKLLI